MRVIAKKAFDLHYTYDGLQPMDSGHMASALWLGCSAFYTYDKALLKIGEHGSMRILEPTYDLLNGQLALLNRAPTR